MKIFWSWQSDTPGKTGRHFIRNAIRDAIAELKEPSELEEPIERERKVALHIDYDRQGVPGSPDLAATIFKKIEDASVFISDVTPVAETAEREGDDGRKYKKKIMNPNAAIELGYAFHCLGDNAVLMVMNGYYGTRSDLPFDLSHKAGPIIFSLPPDADSKKIKAEATLLKREVIRALRPYLKVPLTKDIEQEESLEAHAQKVDLELKAKRARQLLLSSPQGVEEATLMAHELFEIVLKKAGTLGFKFESRNDVRNRLFLLCEGIGLSIHWDIYYSNSLDGAELLFALWRGAPPGSGQL